MANCSHPQCSSLTAKTLPVAPNPDISGLGVLIGFMATAYITLILVLIHYLLDCGPQPLANPIDRGIINLIWRSIGRRPSKKWGIALRRGILMFSDQQVVTGIAILLAGYSQLRCGLSSYHWDIVVHLAWSSSVTHLTTLTILYQYFRDNPLIRSWRAALMLATVMPLGAALLPTGNLLWGVEFGVPAQCFFDVLAWGRNGAWYSMKDWSTLSMIFSLLVLFASFVTRIIKFSKKGSDFTRRWIRSKPGDLLKWWLDELNRRARIDGASFFWKLLHEIFLGVYVILKAILDIQDSMVWEVNWLIYALAWGTLRLHWTRDFTHFDYGDTLSAENYWGFGQWMPVLLLMLPLLAMGEISYELSRDSASEADILSNAQSGGHDISRRTTSSINRDSTQATIFSPTHVLSPANGDTDTAIVSAPRAGSELDAATRSYTSDNHPPMASRLSRGALGMADVESFVAEASTNRIANTSYHRDFYQYTWFRLLILLILLFIAMVVIVAFASLPDFLYAMRRYGHEILVIFLPLPTYTLFFLFVEDYENEVSKLLRALRIPGDVQQKLSPYVPYFVLFFLLAPVGIWLHKPWIFHSLDNH